MLSLLRDNHVSLDETTAGVPPAIVTTSIPGIHCHFFKVYHLQLIRV